MRVYVRVREGREREMGHNTYMHTKCILAGDHARLTASSTLSAHSRRRISQRKKTPATPLRSPGLSRGWSVGKNYTRGRKELHLVVTRIRDRWLPRTLATVQTAGERSPSWQRESIDQEPRLKCTKTLNSPIPTLRLCMYVYTALAHVRCGITSRHWRGIP